MLTVKLRSNASDPVLFLMLTCALIYMVSTPVFARHAVRDDFPNGKGRGVTFELYLLLKQVEVWGK